MRWHAPTCLQPDVYVADGGPPACRHCGKSARDMPYSYGDSCTSLPLLPPDEPEGCLDLWWPPSVPYTSNGSPSEIDNETKDDTDGLTLSGLTIGLPEASVKPLVSSAGPANDHIYERPLTPQEFRLACLSAIPRESDTSFPIHLSFEIFENDHYPDYDAVSYAWGGGNNDRVHNSPIYVGDYWDVLNSTRNCWAVLRYLRPCNGTRLVWLDFISINQLDMNEKAHQIQQMGKIYSHCSQVFLWLGEGAVCHDQRALPSRRLFENLEDPENLDKILSRKYFTRVWVIQELVLSPRISMPYADIVVEISPQSLMHIEQKVKRSSAPWFNLATKGSSHNLSWAEIMVLTLSSKSSDPRDGLYGVLGLRPCSGPLPLPSYSISYQHMMIGIFAWRLIRDGEDGILYAAKGAAFTEYEDPLPSWIPPWKGHNYWKWAVEVTSSPNTYIQEEYDVGEPYASNGHQITRVKTSHGRCWNHCQITVDRNNGTLSLWTTKIRDVQSSCWNACQYYTGASWRPCPNIWVSECGLYVQARKSPDRVVEKGDELHILNPRSSEQSPKGLSTFIFLRRVANKTYKLVQSGPAAYLRSSQFCGSVEDVYADRSFALDILKEVWDLSMYEFDKAMDNNGALGRDLQKSFPGNEDTPFHVLLAVILDNHDFERLLKNDIARRLDAKVETAQTNQDSSQFLTLKFSKADWEVARSLYDSDTEGNQGSQLQFKCANECVASHTWDGICDEHWKYTQYDAATGIPFGSGTGQFRHQNVMYSVCKLSQVRRLLHKIDDTLCITGIWGSLGLSRPEGSMRELRYAQSVYHKGIRKSRRRRSYCGNNAIVGLESHIQIV